MLASNMPAAVAQALRACARTVTVTGPSSSASRVLAQRTFLIAPSYKARVAVRGYATATATATKAPATRSNKARIAPADAQRKRPAAKKAKAKAKAKAKPKAKAKAKKPVKKKKSGTPKKVMSPEKKAVLEKRLLRKTSLLYGEPKKETVTLWTTYMSERLQNESLKAGSGNDFGNVIKRLAVDFKSIPASERARIEEKNLQNKATNAGNYKKWVESYSVEEIYKANLARQRLIKFHNVKTRKIIDERMPKRPVSAFALFVKARVSGHTGGMVAAVKDISTEWKSLSPAEKRPFEDLATAEKTRYVRDMEGTGLPTPTIAT